jgi:hypothetical protein
MLSLQIRDAVCSLKYTANNTCLEPFLLINILLANSEHHQNRSHMTVQDKTLYECKSAFWCFGGDHRSESGNFAVSVVM